MHVKDLMTREVVTIAPGASLREVAATFLAHGISGAPVCDEAGHVLGVVSKRDILHKEQGPDDRGRRLLGRFRAGTRPGKREARTAGEAMTQPAITVSTFTSVAAAARLMLERGVHRLPVVSRGTIAGILTEGDLVRAFSRPDEEIAREIHEELQWQLDLPSSHAQLAVHVVDGAVVVTGEVERRSDVEIADHVIRRVPGVDSVDLDITWRRDDIGKVALTRV